MSHPIKERYEIPNEIPFPLRLHIMLQQTEIAGQASIVSWMPSGKSFRVHDREVFSKEILPEYFRSSNFRSFQRNLSVYQFSRIWSGPEKGAYFHENFVRHNRVLCAVMKRHVPHKKDHVTLDPSSSSKKVTSETETTTIQETTMARGGQADMGVADDKNTDDGDMLAETTKGSETGAAEQKYSGEGTRTLVVSVASSSSSSSTSFRKLPPPAATRALLQPEQPQREPVVVLQQHTTNRGLPLIAGSEFPLDASGIARVDHLPGVGILAPTSRTGENGSWSGSTSSSSYRGEATFAPDKKDVAIYFGERDHQHQQGRRLRSNSAPASTFLQVYSANESGGFDLNQQDSTNTLSAAKVPTTFGSSRTSGGDRIVGRGVTTTSFTGSPPSSSSSDDDPFLLDRLWSQTVDATTSTTVASKENSSMEDSISRRRATRTFRDGSDDDRGRLLSSPQGIPYSDDKASSSEEPREGSSSSKDDGSSNNKHMFTAAGDTPLHYHSLDDDAGGGGGMTSPSPEKEERRSRGPVGRRIKGPSSSNNQQGYSSSSGDDTASFLRDLW